MKGLAKWVGGITLALIVLVILAAVVLPKVIDPNDYREDISALVKDKTGMTLTINGEIGWSVFPWLGLNLNDLRIDDTRHKQLGALNHAAVKVKLLPLLSQKVEISNLELSGLKLDLEVDAQGQANWEPAQPTQKASESSTTGTDTTSMQTEPATGTSLPAFDIASVAITGLNINYRDIPANRTVAITQARLETGAVLSGLPFDLDASFNLSSSDSNRSDSTLSAQIKLAGRLALRARDSKFKANNLQLSVTPLGTSSPVSLSLTGDVTVSKDDVVTGNLKVPAIDLARFMEQLHLPVPGLAGGDQVLRKVSLGSSFRKEGNSLSLGKVTASLDNFQLDGNIAITDLNKQAITFNITGSDLIVDPYLPVAASEQDSATAPSTVPSSTDTQTTGDEVIIPVDVIQQLDIKGTAQLASLTAKGFLFEKPTLEVKAENGLAQISKLNAGFYKGMIDGAAGVDVSGKLARQPGVSARADIKGIDIESLSSLVVNLNQVKGETNASLKVIGHGLTQNQIIRSLNGEVGFEISNGMLLGTNFNKSVCSLVARVRKEQMTKTDWPNQTEFKSLKGTVKIIEGVARNRDLTAGLDQLNLEGDGEVNLINQTMDYHLGLTITGDTASEEESACRINEKYADISWPLRCKGKIGDKGLCGVDEQRLGKTLGKLAGREVKDKLKKKLEDKLGDSLKGLFK